MTVANNAVTSRRVAVLSGHVTGKPPGNPEPAKFDWFSDASLVSIIALWGYGLLMPMHGLYNLVQYKSYHTLLAYGFVQALSKLPRDSPFFKPCSYLYKLIFATHFQDTEFLTPSILGDASSPRPEKNQVIIAGPHGLFSLSLMRIVPENTSLMLFVDDTLATVNPFIPLFAKWSGMQDLQGLKNKKVTAQLRKGGSDVMVVAGGFEEASVGTYSTNRICRQTWGYWMRQALQKGYDISFLWVYGGTQVFNQPEFALSVRHMFAKRSIPCIMPLGKLGLPIPTNTPLRIINVRVPLPHIPECTKEDAVPYLEMFETKVQELLKEFPPPPGLAPIMPFKPWSKDISKTK